MEDTVISLKDFIMMVIEEKEVQYDVRFRAAEVAVQAALVSQNKETSTAFLSSEKAVLKSEQAQDAYNKAHNDLIKKMDDQHRETIPRLEAMALLKALEDRLVANKDALDVRLENTRASSERERDELRKQIAGLRESRSEGVGSKGGVKDILVYVLFSLSLAATIILHFVK